MPERIRYGNRRRHASLERFRPACRRRMPTPLGSADGDSSMGLGPPREEMPVGAIHDLSLQEDCPGTVADGRIEVEPAIMLAIQKRQSASRAEAIMAPRLRLRQLEHGLVSERPAPPPTDRAPQDRNAKFQIAIAIVRRAHPVVVLDRRSMNKPSLR
ncbi:hypothethical protein (plasmid) [Ralstonia solanacearum PSI07]|nr:hypothethical protein [Ralstonia solanacearum PSI07]